ncbi:MAG TPA: hypothetical protein VN765_06010, partial [Candidatus Acidoferrum sp.]|nr:hypothetical protein [Candidatus Acidoferrum sp.]
MLDKPKAALRNGAVLLAMAATLAAQAAPALLNARLIARPVTPGDVAKYGLPANTENSAGLNTVGIGTPVYLEVDVNLAFPASTITNVSFAITQKPNLSGATITANTFPTNMGLFEPADHLIYQVAGRAVLRPDATTRGLPYIVTATIGTLTNGTTNVTLTINAGTYLGYQPACVFCHSPGGGAPPKVPFWETTEHASMFTRGIDGVLSSHYSASCEKCHTVGYDTNAASLADNGFYSVATAEGWTFPPTLNSNNWASMVSNYPDVANLANIQCENCHGPASEHWYASGDHTLAYWPRI